ncbi:MAG: tRNA glutamyl-Q(34) synthetase GluQRS [Burkholderiaceae bacterium]|nr:tRNA glutamyl-Q(34) synthetase GluQRS [Burkholderiaceae bacterium]
MTHSLNPQFNQGTRSEEGPASKRPYRGRFAPSPTGPLHLGSLATALGSWLDAKAHGGTWLVRIEDVDTPRTVTGADQLILDQLQACGLEWDEAPVWQSQRTTHYQNALEQLITIDRIYGCQCSRKQIEEVLQKEGVLIKPNQELIYPGTCRERKVSIQNHALRIRLPRDCQIGFTDRDLGKQTQDLNTQVGDFVLRRADGLFTYQLAVVVDDHLQEITTCRRNSKK